MSHCRRKKHRGRLFSRDPETHRGGCKLTKNSETCGVDAKPKETCNSKKDM